jgi:hypothetical protein
MDRISPGVAGAERHLLSKPSRPLRLSSPDCALTECAASAGHGDLGCEALEGAGGGEHACYVGAQYPDLADIADTMEYSSGSRGLNLVTTFATSLHDS